MSDNTNFMNTYVNLAVETVHNYLNEILQLKTQLSIVNSLISEKDQTIAALSEEMQSLKTSQQNQSEIEEEMQKLRDNAASWEFQYNNMTGKVSHMDTLANQHNELQKQFVNQTSEFEKTTSTLIQLKQKTEEYEQQINTLTLELASANRKIERLTKKEVKKVSDSLPSRTIINKEETKSTPITQKDKSVVEEKLKEIDDDF